MTADFDWSQLASLSSAETFAVRETEMQSGSRRLEGSFYGSAGYRAVQALEKSGFTLLPVSDCFHVEMPTRFARVRVSNADCGVPFMTGSGAMVAKPEKDDLLSLTLTPNLEEIRLQENTVIVTRSGTVGNVAFVTKDLAGFAGTDDLIRVSEKRPEYSIQTFYVFAQSVLGKALFTNDRYGGVIEHIEPHHVEQMTLPLFPRILRARLTELIQKASEARVCANALLDEAQELVQRSCLLPDSDKVRGKHVIGEQDDCIVFSIKTSEIAGRKWGNRRLDASFYHPSTDALRARILDHELGCTLGSVLLGVQNSTLRKREYVDDPEQGVPMLGGKQLIQIRPQEVKYLSNVLTRNLKSETVKQGWTLVSCGGTLGRTLYVHQNYEGWAFSQHVMRLIPNPNRVFSGFIYAFMSSPYGQLQIQQRSYGSVIPEIRDEQFKSIALRIPKDKGRAVHEKVEKSFDLRAEALKAENDALALFSDALERGRTYVEREWGADY